MNHPGEERRAANSKSLLGIRVPFIALIALLSLAPAQGNGAGIGDLQSADPGIRSDAFYALVASTQGSDAQVNLAIINLLTTENSYALTLTESDDEGYGEYYSDVVTFVCSLNDPRALTPLIEAI